MQLSEHCTLCPRRCGANRAAGRTGYCGAGDTLLAARAALHHWEEPCLSGDPNAATGSGTVFFTGCTLQCCYCQNYKISQQGLGKPLTAERLAEIFMELQQKGAKNLNLVTATQWLPWVTQALDAGRRNGLTLPVAYNTGGYETVETVKALAGYVDIWRITNMPALPWRKSFPPRRITHRWRTPPSAKCCCRPVPQCTMPTATCKKA